MVARNLLFTIIIANFGKVKVAIDTALLMTFCDTIKYTTPQEFPDLSAEYRPLVDIFSLSVMVYKYIYALPNPPNVPVLRNNNEGVLNKQWYNWLDERIRLLLDKLKDEGNDPAIQILVCLMEIKVSSR